MAVLLLSDLHLPDSPSPLRGAFIDFLRGPARRAEAVYILGDLFNYWIDDGVGIEAYPEEIAALKELCDSGVPVYFMGGNRDFIVGAPFFVATGVQPLPDPALVELAGRPVLLSHGDRYCTDDVSLQRWRRFSAKEKNQRVWYALPVALRRRIALWLRGRSKHKKQSADYDARIMDVNAAAIVEAFSGSEANYLIHGHTHLPADHQLMVNGRNCERIVLSDWHGRHGEYLEWDAQGRRRVPIDVPIANTKPGAR